MIIPMLCVTIFVILVVWFLLPRVTRLIIHTPTSFFFFFNDTATNEIYTLSLHDALPISSTRRAARCSSTSRCSARRTASTRGRDRKSTRLNSSHSTRSYADFCLKKKNELRAVSRRRGADHRVLHHPSRRTSE